MEATAPVVRFVKCPKCLKILTEFAEVPVYKCGGCGTILRAKAHSLSRQNLSTISANPASQNLTGIDPSSNESANIGENTDLDVSDSNIISMEKSLEHEQTESNKVPDPEDNEEVEQSGKVNLNSSLKSSESSETMEHSTTSEEDAIKMEFANGVHFRMNTTISTLAYDGSASSTDEDGKDHLPRKFHLSRRTFRNKYASDSLDSTEAGEKSIPDDIFPSQAPFRSSNSPTEDAKDKTNHRFSKQDYQVKILNKVDELRNELKGLFSETANGLEFSGKFLSKENRPSLVPLARRHPSHFSTINQGPRDLKLKTLRPQSVISLCRPVSGGAPFVICYECLKLLHLPGDFLVSPKKVHKLRCGACLQVLLFSFKPRSRSIPQTPREQFQHPPTEESKNSRSRSEETMPWHQNSSSGDSYLSLHNSNSGEVEAAMNKPRSYDDEIVVEEEEGEGRDMSGSRLHSLLGYSSARDLLFKSDYSSDGNSSMDSGMPNFDRPYGRRRWDGH
ncbi:hypothetical protein KSP40_PGU021199 [Platanthera guangdongensis]|uniref:Zinc-ribbon domain-containing protein n=1 Tax=Platanthera guangdongensis TaxID=2320717 RepID=A0ABR2MBD0_9ASPA